VLLGVIKLEWMVDGRTLFHELDRAARVGRDVADGEQAVRKLGTTDDVCQPRRVFWPKQALSVRNRDQPRSADRPVDPVHYHRRVRRYLRTSHRVITLLSK